MPIRDWVAKNLNLAAKLFDGAKVYIPRIGEAATQITNSNNQNSIDSQSSININAATSDSLRFAARSRAGDCHKNHQR